jgi:serine protease Do
MIEEDIMRNRRTLIVVLSIMITFLFLVSCSQAYSSGQKPPEADSPLASQPVRSEPLVPTLEQIQYSFQQVAQEALPVVVEINTIDVVTQRIPRGQSPWDFFFGPSPSPGDSEEREFRQPGLGSGVIVARTNGKVYVLTNNHVAGEADEISISLYDGRQFTGKLVGSDPRRDLAVVMFETREEIPVARLGDSEAMQVGDLVLAVGNPFGFESTITMGIVSALGRQADSASTVASLTEYIQTDASINPGNSGGALVNLRGEVIGINTWIASRTGSSAGLGFAVPINTAKKTVDEILTKGRVEYGWLGVQIVDVDPQRFPDYREDFSLGNEDGSFVVNIFKGSPAFEAGILPGDYITSIAGRNVRDTSELTRIVGNLPPGNRYDVSVIRAGREQSFDIRLAIREEDKEIAAQSKNLWPGMYIASLSADLREQLTIPEDLQGVLVTVVQEGSPAAEAGFRQGDVVQEVDDRDIRNAYDFYQALNNATGREMDTTVFRQNEEIDLQLQTK